MLLAAGKEATAGRGAELAENSNAAVRALSSRGPDPAHVNFARTGPFDNVHCKPRRAAAARDLPLPDFW